MTEFTVLRRCALFVLGAIGTILLVACGGDSSSTVASVPPPAVDVPATLALTPTPEPTLPLPNITVEELYNTAAGEEAGSYPAPSVDESGLPQPVIQEEFDAPVAPTAEATVASSYPEPVADTGLAAVVPTATADPTRAAVEPPRLPQTSPEDHYWMIRPVAEGGVVWTDKFYPYGSTRGGTLRTHHGVEFNVGAYDVPILATADGTVIFAGPDDEVMLGPQLDFYGDVVVVEHDFLYEGQPIYSLYAHLNGVTVVVGQKVGAGDIVGLSGASGIADAVHLHFEVRVGANDYESTRNPVLWLWPFPEDGTIVGRVTFPDGSLATEYPVSIHKVDPGEHPVIQAMTYADDRVNGDDRWPENFAFDDVEAGRYEVYAKIGNKEYNVEVVVEPRKTAYVELVIGE